MFWLFLVNGYKWWHLKDAEPLPHHCPAFDASCGASLESFTVATSCHRLPTVANASCRQLLRTCHSRRVAPCCTVEKKIPWPLALGHLHWIPCFNPKVLFWLLDCHCNLRMTFFEAPPGYDQSKIKKVQSAFERCCWHGHVAICALSILAFHATLKSLRALTPEQLPCCFSSLGTTGTWATSCQFLLSPNYKAPHPTFIRRKDESHLESNECWRPHTTKILHQKWKQWSTPGSSST